MVNNAKPATAFMLALLLAPTLAGALEFNTMESGSGTRYIRASGSIKVGDAALLRGLITLDNQRSVVVWNSDGGSVTEAMKIGRDLRRNGVDVLVLGEGRCLSACILSFIGGNNRAVAKDGSLGSHQFYWPAGEAPPGEAATALTQSLSAQVLRHFLALDVDPEALSLIMETAPEKMLVFSPALLTRFKLVGKAVPAGASTAQPMVAPDGEQREGCPFPESFINSDPLDLYPACKR